MACETQIPVRDLAELIISDYGDTFVRAILDQIDLSKYVTIENGSANNLALRGTVTADSVAAEALCSILSTCINAKIEEAMACNNQCCDNDNRVTNFSIDKANGQLTITMKGGEVYTVSDAELKTWLGISGGGISGGTLQGNTLLITNGDGSTTPIDLSGLAGKGILGGTASGNTITVNNPDGTTATIDVSGLTDKGVTGAAVNGNVLSLTNPDGSKVNIDLSNIANGGGVKTATMSGTTLTLTNKDNTTVSVDLKSLRDGLATAQGGVQSGAINGNNLVLTNKDGSQATIDISRAINGGGVGSGSVSGDKLTLTNKDGSSTQIDLSALINSLSNDKYITGGSIVSGSTLRLTRNDGVNVDVNLANLTLADLTALKNRVAELEKPCTVGITNVASHTVTNANSMIISSGGTITFPTGLTVGRQFTVVQGGNTEVKLVGASGVTVVAPYEGSLTLAGSNAVVTAVVTATNQVRIFGNTKEA